MLQLIYFDYTATERERQILIIIAVSYFRNIDIIFLPRSNFIAWCQLAVHYSSSLLVALHATFRPFEDS